MLTIELPDETEKHFIDLASKTGKTTTELLTDAINELMEDLEDYAECVEIMKNSKPEDYTSMEELKKELDLDN